jgi:hypothetical protein
MRCHGENELLIHVSRWYYIYSFIHFEHLYSASSRGLLRGAPDPGTAKKSSLKLGVKCLGGDSGEQAKGQREAIPCRRTHNIYKAVLIRNNFFH